MNKLGVMLATAFVATFVTTVVGAETAVEPVVESVVESVVKTEAEAVVLSGKLAKKMLFSHKGSEFVILKQDFMTDADVKLLNLMSGMDQFKAVLYYGAIAASPSDGVTHKATLAVSSHHTPAAAAAAAISECNALRSEGPDCVVVAQILPRKYSEQAFSLSASATVTLKKTYLRGRGPKAMAISPSAGSYGVAKGEAAVEAALEACAADPAAKSAADCLIVVQD